MAVRRLHEEQPEAFAFTADNMNWAEATIRKFPEGRQASAVIPLLMRAQEQEGWVSKPAIESVAEMLGMPTIRVLEVATFYTQFQLQPVGRKAHVQVCGTTPCRLSGAEDIIRACERRIAHHHHELSADGDFSWEEVECLGACVNAPMVQIGKDNYEDLTVESFEALLDGLATGNPPKPGPQSSRHVSEPITGLTALTDIDYDALEHAQAEKERAAGTPAAAPAGERTIDANAPESAAVAPDAPKTGISETAGGEQFESEQRRREGKVDPASSPSTTSQPGAANQEVGRVDPSGRSDQAASNAMANPGADAARPKETPAERTPAREDHERPGTRTDTDTGE
ncbi:NADH-quinone oxidoreductase subunit E [Faunimonas pinastri]|uniref:NADH-quinone oxidoreductase subunit E n=1 Tax=Faunimonas pinastri TaxID=1855383 RepID=A0A1H9J9B3_9HYPH|nr:NADH-quinone oxidoreductase subunit NuoE [Faunimonas pinastri]SEQ83460.1 NADH-quinone oxidoreductase subunit E [Faunimonas pinastri]